MSYFDLYPFGGPYNKDHCILGFILGYPYFGKLPCMWGVSVEKPLCWLPASQRIKAIAGEGLGELRNPKPCTTLNPKP